MSSSANVKRLAELVDSYERYDPAVLSNICNLSIQLGEEAEAEIERLDYYEAFWVQLPERPPWSLMKMLLSAGFRSSYLYRSLSPEDVVRLTDEQWDDYCDTFCEEDDVMDATMRHMHQFYSKHPFPADHNPIIAEAVRRFMDRAPEPTPVPLRENRQ